MGVLNYFRESNSKVRIILIFVLSIAILASWTERNSSGASSVMQGRQGKNVVTTPDMVKEVTVVFIWATGLRLFRAKSGKGLLAAMLKDLNIDKEDF